MSQENVEIVLALQPPPELDHLQFFGNAELWSSTFAMFASYFEPDFETTGTLLGTQMTFIGSEGCRELLMHWYEPWTSYRIVSQEAIDLGDRVLVTHDAFGRLPGSEAEVKLSGASLYTLRDGKVARIAFYLDRAEALKAVGLSDASPAARNASPRSR
jgi:ketosteroid isomerase-like protein